jgi:hypothetical protein
MSTGTVEVVPAGDLEELLAHDPLCEAAHNEVPCTRPAVARVKVTCGTCGAAGTVFLCAPCLVKLKAGEAVCYPGCGAADWGWAGL